MSILGHASTDLAIGCRFVLISVGTTVAYVYSVFAVIYGRAIGGPDYRALEFFETSALLITFIALGKLLEGAAKGRTSKVSFVLSAIASMRRPCIGCNSTAANHMEPCGSAYSGPITIFLHT